MSKAAPECAPISPCMSEEDGGDGESADRNVTVVVRVRPLSGDEARRESEGRRAGGVLDVKGPMDLVVGGGAGSGVAQADRGKRFTFDHVLDRDAAQEAVFRRVGKPVVDNCLAGYNSTVLAYGQTGSGKTHTMLGELPPMPRRSWPRPLVTSDDGGSATDRSDASGSSLASTCGGESQSGSPGPAEMPLEAGLTPRVFGYLFEEIAARQASPAGAASFAVRLSFVEIYNEVVVDLLADPAAPCPPPASGLAVRQSVESKRTYVEGAREEQVYDMAGVLELIRAGSERRRVAHTGMNAASSRSHSILTAVIESRTEEGRVGHIRRSVLNLVDLAGSERQARTRAAGARLKEASAINKSLSTLGHVIRSLVAAAPHVPYRDSKLTHILQDSLGGNAKAVMIAAVSPATASQHETESTLGFASRARRMKNSAVVNEDAVGDAAALRSENQRLKGELAAFRALEASRAASEGHARAEAERLRAEVAALKACENAAQGRSGPGFGFASGGADRTLQAADDTPAGACISAEPRQDSLDLSLAIAAEQFGSWRAEDLEEQLEAALSREGALSEANAALSERLEGVLAATHDLEGRVEELQARADALRADRDAMSQENSSLRVAADLVAEYNAAFRRATQEADQERLRAAGLQAAVMGLEDELRVERHHLKAEAQERELLLSEFSELTKLLGEAVQARQQALADRDAAVQGKLQALQALQGAQDELHGVLLRKAAVQQQLADLADAGDGAVPEKEDCLHRAAHALNSSHTPDSPAAVSSNQPSRLSLSDPAGRPAASPVAVPPTPSLYPVLPSPKEPSDPFLKVVIKRLEGIERTRSGSIPGSPLVFRSGSESMAPHSELAKVLREKEAAEEAARRAAEERDAALKSLDWYKQQTCLLKIPGEAVDGRTPGRSSLHVTLPGITTHLG